MRRLEADDVWLAIETRVQELESEPRYVACLTYWQAGLSPSDRAYVDEIQARLRELRRVQEMLR